MLQVNSCPVGAPSHGLAAGWRGGAAGVPSHGVGSQGTLAVQSGSRGVWCQDLLQSLTRYGLWEELFAAATGYHLLSRGAASCTEYCIITVVGGPGEKGVWVLVRGGAVVGCGQDPLSRPTTPHAHVGCGCLRQGVLVFAFPCHFRLDCCNDAMHRRVWLPQCVLEPLALRSLYLGSHCCSMCRSKSIGPR